MLLDRPTDSAKKPPSWMPTPDHTPAYLRTSAQVLDAMRGLQARYPDLVQVVDIGDSARKAAGLGGNDVWLLRMTNRRTQLAPFAKPTVTHTAGMHAREIANPELLMQWAAKLLDGYGRDANATAMLDTRIIDLVPIVNPDGHDIVTDGFANGRDVRIWQRKNANPAGEVDLNRNFRWGWNGFGTSRDPSSDIYRGPRAASEPETQAIQGLLETSRPNMYMDWHSYSQLNLYPWGDTFVKAPDHTGLRAISDRFAQLNGYTSQQSADLYPTSGTSTDHAYGVHRIPAIGVETGMAFHPMEAAFADIQRRNEPVLDLSVAIADAPYERIAGPTVEGVQLASDGTISAAVSDAQTGAQAIRAAEWTLNPLAAPGAGTPLAARDGAFDGVSEQLTGAFVAPTALAGAKLIYVRAQDADGQWGVATPQWITPPATA